MVKSGFAMVRAIVLPQHLLLGRIIVIVEAFLEVEKPGPFLFLRVGRRTWLSRDSGTRVNRVATAFLPRPS